MSEYSCFLVTIYSESSKCLYKYSIEIHNKYFRDNDYRVYASKAKAKSFFTDLLPKHITRYGQVVEIQRILSGGRIEDE